MTDTVIIEDQPDDSPLIDFRMMPIYAESARKLVAEGALTSASKVQQVLDLFVREGRRPAEAETTISIAFAIARQVNSVLLAASAPYGSTLRAEMKLNGESTPAYVARMLAANAEEEAAPLTGIEVIRAAENARFNAEQERMAQGRPANC